MKIKLISHTEIVQKIMRYIDSGELPLLLSNNAATSNSL